jgi:hypothetical protein
MKLSANGSCTANEVSKAMAARHDIVKLKCSRTLQGGGYHSGPLKIRLVQRKQVTSKRSEAVQKMLEKGARTLETPDTKDQGTNMWIANGQTKHKRGIKALKIGHCSA